MDGIRPASTSSVSTTGGGVARYHGLSPLDELNPALWLALDASQAPRSVPGQSGQHPAKFIEPARATDWDGNDNPRERMGDPESRPEFQSEPADGRVTTLEPPLEISEERKLLDRLSRGDSESFWELWAIYQRPVFKICLARLEGRHAEAEDVSSRVMQKAQEALPRFAPTIRNLNAWLARLTGNLCIDSHRVDQRRCQGVCGLQPGRQAENLARLVSENGLSPDASLVRCELGRAIAAAIAGLPSRLRDSARLFFIEERSYAEIAQALRISNANARKRIQDARARLKLALSEYAI